MNKCIFLCGNGILDLFEQCDNRNALGCKNCRIDPGYECDRNSPSNCFPVGICGDGIRQRREECDNGNRIGCRNCFEERGYQCNGLVGSSSICTQLPVLPVCGNSILEVGEECDNGNKLGCSWNCRIDSAYNCMNEPGQSSVCSLCGNNIV